MKRNLAAAPEGTKEKIFAECVKRRDVERKLYSLFRRRGYSEVITPVVEYLDALTAAGNPMPQSSMLKLIDKNGQILVMRPDTTTPIARLAAGRLANAAFPQRLFYMQDVYRSCDSYIGRSLETAQAGIELVGASGNLADLEVISMAVHSLSAASVPRFHIELGHACLFSALADDLGADNETVETMRQLIEGKNFAALGDLLGPYSHLPSAKALEQLSSLFGGEEVLDEADALITCPEARRALEYLRMIHNSLKSSGIENIFFDLGQVSSISYYTGIVFRGYADGAGAEIITGGRYDNLISGFGRDLPAIGFAIDIDAVCDSIPSPEWAWPKTLIHYSPEQLCDALSIIDDMPDGSCELSCCANLEDTIALARLKLADTVLNVTGSGTEHISVERPQLGGV